jgi:uncharacterized Zn finger protein
MSCPRCAGLMVNEVLEDHESTYLQCAAFKCLSCGEIIDATILRHREQRSLVKS